MFFTRIAEKIAEVEADHDLITIDCPPQPGPLTLSAPAAAAGAI